MCFAHGVLISLRRSYDKHIYKFPPGFTGLHQARHRGGPAVPDILSPWKRREPSSPLTLFLLLKPHVAHVRSYGKMRRGCVRDRLPVEGQIIDRDTLHRMSGVEATQE